MRRFIIVSVSLLAFVLGVSGFAFSADIYKNLEIGLAFDFRLLRLNAGAIPDQVKKEAANPTTVNPHSGRLFTSKEIGSYDPTENFKFVEAGLFAKYTVPINFPIKPYLRVELQYPLGASTDRGSFGKGYTYEKVLGTGVDYVRYIYGMEYKYSYWLEPEIGLSYVKANRYSISLGVSYQRLELEYKKGIEAWGSPESLKTLGTSQHDLFNYKLNFTKYWGDLAFSFEPSLTTGNGVDGGAIALSFQWRF